MQNRKVHHPNLDNRDMMLYFNEVDANHSGAIDAKELKRALRKAGVKYSTKEARKMIDMFDIDGSGTITFDEFQGLYDYLREMDIAFDSHRHRDKGLKLRDVQGIFGTTAPLAALPQREQHTERLFKKHDTFRRGRITKKQFIMIAIALGILLTVLEHQHKKHKKQNQLKAKLNKNKKVKPATHHKTVTHTQPVVHHNKHAVTHPNKPVSAHHHNQPVVHHDKHHAHAY
jgi:hypothetical protein